MGWLPHLAEIQSLSLYCIDPRGAPFPNVARCSLTAPSHRRAHRWYTTNGFCSPLAPCSAWLLPTSGAIGCCPSLAPAAAAHHCHQWLLPTTGASGCSPNGASGCCPPLDTVAAAHYRRRASGASDCCQPLAPAAAAHHWCKRLLPTTGTSGCSQPLAPVAATHYRCQWRQRLLPTTGASGCISDHGMKLVTHCRYYCLDSHNVPLTTVPMH
jgi:hypothetical protein